MGSFYTAKPNLPVEVLRKASIGVNGHFIISICGATVIRLGIPATAAHDAVLANSRAARIALRAVLIIVLLVEVVAPFPNVAGQVAKTPGVSGLLSDRMWASRAVSLKPGEPFQIFR